MKTMPNDEDLTYSIMKEEFPEITEFVDKRKWRRFNELKRRKTPIELIEEKLKIKKVLVLELNHIYKCSKKWSGDKEKIKKCINREIDP